VWLSWKKGYKLRLTTKAYKLSYNYINYTINLVGRSFGRWRRSRLRSGRSRRVRRIPIPPLVLPIVTAIAHALPTRVRTLSDMLCQARCVLLFITLILTQKERERERSTICTLLRTRGSIPNRGRMCSFLPSFQTDSGAHPPSCGYKASFLLN
jgi:hypothetical protein